MSESSMLDKAFNIIMIRMVESGLAPYYSDIAAELGLCISVRKFHWKIPQTKKQSHLSCNSFWQGQRWPCFFILLCFGYFYLVQISYQFPKL